jgi:CHAT domain-containing protein
MTRFYRHMLDPQHPRKPAEALRMAQLALSENPRWRHPFFWGAFVLLGDWQ